MQPPVANVTELEVAPLVAATEVEEWEASLGVAPQPARRAIPPIDTLIPTFGHRPTVMIILTSDRVG
jgi:hypothetical protein